MRCVIPAQAGIQAALCLVNKSTKTGSGWTTGTSETERYFTPLNTFAIMYTYLGVVAAQPGILEYFLDSRFRGNDTAWSGFSGAVLFPPGERRIALFG